MHRRIACTNDMPIKEASASFTGHSAVARMIPRA